MNFGVLVFPGSNCDHDAYHAAAHILGADTKFIWHKDTDLGNSDVIIVPGGFSYGDYLRSGAIAKYSPVMKSVIDFANKGGLVIGICNGMQILTEAQLVPGAMLHNEQLRFTCKQTYIKTKSNKTAFTSGLSVNEVLQIPIAHGEGNYFIDEDGLKSLQDNDQIIFTYCDSDGLETPEANPNGTLLNIAGVSNKQGNVLAMMPHPERAVEKQLGSDDGLKIFESILSFAR
ncbi:phosphoribosylformylglycinamidine synthase subunit PurQ [bacterium]|nr:MAG: phosphoribosylformylglycinamidine synthase subunit PurQ [bacterium]